MEDSDRKFSYHKGSRELRTFAFGLAGLLAVEAAVAVFLIALLADSPVWRAVLIFAFIAPLAYGVLGLFSVFRKSHVVSDSGVAIRQGWRFKGFIGKDTIVRAERASEKHTGMFPTVRHISDQELLLVATGDTGLVSISLNRPQYFRPPLAMKRVAVKKVVVNVDDSDGFIDAVNGLVDDGEDSVSPQPAVPVQHASNWVGRSVEMGSPSGDYAIRTAGLVKRYGDLLAVDDLNLAIRPGEIFGFLGPNGAGKTTTMNMVTGLLQPTEGHVFVQGMDIWKEPLKAKAVLGYVADTSILYDRLTGREFLTFMAQLYDTGAGAEERIARILTMLDLDEWADHMIKVYSHGMRRKMAIAGALVHDPRVLVLDEPITGLDPRAAKRVKDVLRDLSSAGVAIFLSTHILEIAATVCDRIGVIYRGRLTAVGSMSELREQTSMPGSDLESMFLSLTEGEGKRETADEL